MKMAKSCLGLLKVLEEGKTHTVKLWTVERSVGDMWVPTGHGVPQMAHAAHGASRATHIPSPCSPWQMPQHVSRAMILPKAKALSSQKPLTN